MPPSIADTTRGRSISLAPSWKACATRVSLGVALGGGGDGYTMLNVLDETKELASDVKIITHVNKTYMR